MLAYSQGNIGRFKRSTLLVSVTTLSPVAMGKRKRQAKQMSMWVATQDLPRTAARPFYTRLNEVLDEHGFDAYVEELCDRFYADEGRPGLAPGRYLRLLLIGYFGGWTPSAPLLGVLRIVRTMRGSRAAVAGGAA